MTIPIHLSSVKTLWGPPCVGETPRAAKEFFPGCMHGERERKKMVLWVGGKRLRIAFILRRFLNGEKFCFGKKYAGIFFLPSKILFVCCKTFRWKTGLRAHWPMSLKIPSGHPPRPWTNFEKNIHFAIFWEIFLKNKLFSDQKNCETDAVGEFFNAIMGNFPGVFSWHV